MTITYRGFRLWRVGRRIAVGNPDALGSFLNWDLALKFIDRVAKTPPALARVEGP